MKSLISTALTLASLLFPSVGLPATKTKITLPAEYTKLTGLKEITMQVNGIKRAPVMSVPTPELPKIDELAAGLNCKAAAMAALEQCQSKCGSAGGDACCLAQAVSAQLECQLAAAGGVVETLDMDVPSGTEMATKCGCTGGAGGGDNYLDCSAMEGCFSVPCLGTTTDGKELECSCDIIIECSDVDGDGVCDCTTTVLDFSNCKSK